MGRTLNSDYEDYLFEQWSAGTFDEQWKKLGIYALDHYHQIPDIPILFMSSWYDVYVKSTLDNFNALSNKNNAQTSLIMGPWLHGDRNNTFSGDVEFGASAAFDGNIDSDWLTCRINWFTRWLIEPPSISEEAPAIRLFQMGGGSGHQDINQRLMHGGRWITATDWPLTASKVQRWYFQQQGQLTTTPPTVKGTKRQFISDPDNPVPTIGGALTSGKPVFVGGAFDQREEARFFGVKGNNLPIAARSDVLVFETAPLEQDVLVVGDVTAHLYIQSDAPDTDFTVKVVDVYPPNVDYPQGFAMNITDGIFRCRYRYSWEQPQLLTKDEVAKITITPFSTCNLFKKGHRIRIEVAGSNYPKFDINPNSGEPEGQGALKRKAVNTIHCGNELSSYIDLTIIPS